MPEEIRTKIQNAKMHGIAAKLGIPHEDLGDFAFEYSDGRTEHTSELYVAEMDKLIQRLEYLLAQKTGETTPLRTVNYRRAKTNVVSIDTPRQDKFLRALWFHYPHRTADGLQKLCLNTIKTAAPKTTKEFQKMIEAVKSMNAREEANPKSNQEAA